MADVNISRGDGPIYFGATPKYQVRLTTGELSMDDYDFEVRFQRGPNFTVTQKDMMMTDGEGNWFVAMDTTKLGVGKVRAIIVADIPDTDYESGTRTEIVVIEDFETILPL